MKTVITKLLVRWVRCLKDERVAVVTGSIPVFPFNYSQIPICSLIDYFAF